MTAGAGISPDSGRVQTSDSAPAGWAGLLAVCPEADYPHTEHWQESVCRHQLRARPKWWSVWRDGQLVGGLGAVLTAGFRRLGGVLPLDRLDSGYEGTSGGPVILPTLPPAVQDQVFVSLVQAYLAARPWGRGTVALALNPSSEARYGHLTPGGAGWIRQDSPTAMVSLAGGIETVASDRLVMNKRNERNRGLRRGAEVFVTHDPQLLTEYYAIYAAASAHWGIRPTPLGLLQELLADPDDHVFFTCVRLDGKVIGGHLCLHFGSRVFAWNGVTDPAFARTHFPATLCFWGDMVEACRREALWLDFGASGGVHSLVGFKKYFGATLLQRGYYVNDGAVLRTLRRGSQLVGRVRHSVSTRWHDGSTGEKRSGGGR